MSAALAEHVLALVRGLGLHVGTVGVTYPDGAFAWRVDARNNDGERWIAEHADFYRASVMLAELCGVDLIDG